MRGEAAQRLAGLGTLLGQLGVLWVGVWVRGGGKGVCNGSRLYTKVKGQGQTQAMQITGSVEVR